LRRQAALDFFEQLLEQFVIAVLPHHRCQSSPGGAVPAWPDPAGAGAGFANAPQTRRRAIKVDDHAPNSGFTIALSRRPRQTRDGEPGARAREQELLRPRRSKPYNFPPASVTAPLPVFTFTLRIVMTSASEPHTEALRELKSWLATRIIGQENLIERLLIALLADGHLLVEGAPGLAKTKAIKTLAEGIEGDFHRVQFTPDLLPGDITGTDIFRPEDGSFRFQPGPIFHNLVLADEINRAPAKVQSALLEAMGERQISVGRTTYPLPELFLVMATQNPIEHEGTYPLPEAQLDRFLLHVRVDYPDAAAEREILKLVRREASRDDGAPRPQRIGQAQIFAARREVLALHMAEAVEEYIVQLVMATRQPAAYDRELAGWIEFGASPRATIALDRCARARAWLAGRDYVSPDDVQNVCPDVLRHRLLLSFDAEAGGVDVNAAIQRILELVAIA
jgi:MoxR-like ATPase